MVNDPPVAAGDGYVVNEDATLVVGPGSGVLANDSDPQSNPLTAGLASGPANGSLTLAADGSFTYTPNGDFNGTDSFTYTVSDGQGGTDTATVTVTVNPVNDVVGPVSDANAAANSVSENAANGTAVGITANASDADGSDTVTYTLSNNAGGRFAIDANSGVITVADGTLLDYESATSHSVIVLATSSDGSTSSQAYTVNLTDVAESTAPVAEDDAAPTDVDTAVVITVLANDSDPNSDPLSVASVTQGANGTVVINGDDTVTYNPDLSFTGTDTFTYTADDGNGGTDTATVTVYVGIAIEGTSAGETIQGTTGADIIFGYAGNDTLQGNNGADVIYGGADDDVLNGQGGADSVFGETGNDTIVWDINDLILDGGSGTDQLQSGTSDIDLTTFAGSISGIEQIDLNGSGNQALTLSAQDVIDISDNDTVTVTGGPPDTVDAGTGWTDGGIAGGYHTYTQGLATLVVDTNMTVNADILI